MNDVIGDSDEQKKEKTWIRHFSCRQKIISTERLKASNFLFYVIDN